MIKGGLFGKLLKQSFIISLISCFILLGGSFVSAGVIPNQLTKVSSDYDSNYKIAFLNKGQIISDYLGTSKSILAFNGNTFFWWGKNGKPYIYTPNYQGFFTTILSCDELTGGSSSPTNCSEMSIGDGYIELFQNFFSKVNIGDYSYYSYSPYSAGGVNCSYSNNGVEVCFSSHEIGNSLCFRTASCYNGCQNGIYACQSFCAGFNGCGGGLTNSQNLSNLTFGSLSYNWIGYAPGQAGYDGQGNIEGDSSEVEQAPITGNVMYASCSNKLAKAWYENNYYSSKMCYSSYQNSTDIYEGAGSVSAFAFTGEDIRNVWFDTYDYRMNGGTGTEMDYLTWFGYRRHLYELFQKEYELAPGVSNPFVGVPVSIFTLMGNIYSYGKPFNNESILEYCNLVLDPSILPNAYTGLYSDKVCSMSTLDWLGDSVGVHAESGQIVQGSSWVGITNRPGMTTPPVGNGGSENSNSTGNYSTSVSGTYQDGMTFINGSFNSLLDSFKVPDNTGHRGIIPSYIIIFMVALIFFRMIAN